MTKQQVDRCENWKPKQTKDGLLFMTFGPASSGMGTLQWERVLVTCTARPPGRVSLAAF